MTLLIIVAPSIFVSDAFLSKSASLESSSSTCTNPRIEAYRRSVVSENYGEFLQMQDKVSKMGEQIEENIATIKELLEKVKSYRSKDLADKLWK